MGKYGSVAIRAVRLIHEQGMAPREAWASAALEVFPESQTSRDKGCPKGAFLGLVAAGKVKRVAPVELGRSGSGKNAAYSLAALRLLHANPELSQQVDLLWRLALKEVGEDPSKVPNHQMDVVVSLNDRKLLLLD